MRRWLPIVLVVVGGSVIVVLSEPSLAAAKGLPYAIGDTLVGCSFIAAGLVGWSRRPMNRSGLLLLLVGLTWFVGNLRWVSDCRSALWWTLGQVFVGIYAAVLVHLLLAFPDGNLTRRLDRALVTIAYLDVTVVALALELFHVPTDYVCRGANPALNLVLVRNDPALYAQSQTLRMYFGVALSVAVVLVLGDRWRRSSRLARRLLTPVLVAGVGASLTVAIGSVTEYRLASDQSLLAHALTPLRDLGLCSIPFGFLVGLLRTGVGRSAVGELVISLGQYRTPANFRDALARALGDPALRVGYWVPDTEAYVDEHGHPFELPTPESAQVPTLLEKDGTPIAVLVHDAALRQTPRLVEAVSVAARISVENERLQAEVQAQLEEMRASRARIVETADAERRRLERDLHDGAQQRLLSLGLILRLAQGEVRAAALDRAATTLEQADEQLRLAFAELRDLARGIHPAILTEEGLASALCSLAERAPVAVSLEIGDLPDLPPRVEAAAYFLVSEALVNVGKHARATRARVSVQPADGHLKVEVADDGIGGAAPAGGSGLRGLEDRVAALGGKMKLDSVPGHGTRVMASIPCE